MPGNKTHRVIFTSIAICWLLLIWGQSAMPASISSQESMTVLNCIPVFFRGITEYAIRKLAHLTEYIILGIFVKNAARFWNVGTSVCFIVGMTAALSDETIQLFAEGRSSQVSDVWLDIFGFCIGAILYVAFSRLIKRFNKKKL